MSDLQSGYPRISIITPSFNQGSYIEKTIKSVLNQNYSNLEYIIIDGGSRDESVDIIKKYESQISYWVSEKDKGQSEALNKGFQKATGDIVAWINSDDWYEEGAFESVVDYFNMVNTEVVIGNCNMVYEDDPSKNFVDRPGEVHFRRMLRYWQWFFCPPQPSIFFKKSILNRVGLLDESLNYAMDLDLWLRMAKYRPFSYLDKTLSHYLIHSASKSGSENGFKKFEPEWKKVAQRHLSNAGLYEKIFFYKAYFLNR